MDNEANTGPFGAHALTVPMNACSKNLPLFLCPNMYFTVRIYYSNIMPTGAYQGYGAPKGAFALNSTVAELAEQLGMDQIELMRKTWCTKAPFWKSCAVWAKDAKERRLWCKAADWKSAGNRFKND